MTGQQLVEKWMAFMRRYVAMTEAQALVCVLWAMHTYVYERFYAVPYLEIWAEHKRSGKSTLASILSQFSRGGRVLTTVRVLSMVKVAESKEGAYVPFMEEAERFNKATLGDERGILASGYQRGAVHELEKASYPTFFPKAFVLIGNVHNVIRDRCISIKLGRQAPSRSWTNERYIAEAEVADLVIAMRDVFKSGAVSVVRTADGAVRFELIDPVWLMSDRDREIWTPLFTLAHALRLNKETLALLTRASVDLSQLKTLPEVVYHPSQGELVEDDQNAADAVLRDLHAVLPEGVKFIPSADVVKLLQDIDTAPWRGWRGDGINAVSLAALLGRFGIHPAPGRVGKVPGGKGRKDTKTVQGYQVADIIAAWVRSQPVK